MAEKRSRRVRRDVRAWTSEVVAQSRLLLAAKTAAAAVLAWYLAPLIPFAEDQYSYYAPLGALVTMSPTLARSARVGVEALVGLGLGIVLGLAGLLLVHAGAPGGVGLGIVIAAGVLAGGIPRLGAGGDWVALAALFVLLLGGSDAEDFSVSYLVTMAFGVLVGLAVNLLIYPPLYLRRASERLSALRGVVTTKLEELADAVAAGELDVQHLEAALDELGRTIAAVTAEVREAEESGRGNPRRRGARRAIEDENARRMNALERTAFLTRDLVDLLLRMQEQHSPGLASPVRETLAVAIRRAAGIIGTPIGADEAPDRLDDAAAAVDALQHAIEQERRGPVSAVADDVAAAVCLRRIVDASRPFV
ncbi:FUSC family protein [Microbacterium sp. HD4P20]|uniref:FUSC family protein n=1 Tax=Microbacterium sp. HD4P20 TaxID=2864874 RepID=UPI001C63E32D|nr:FUSC family protein [Microbacterium sp. HD4P20]MCP2637184.1 FUSC family protein [Microbacterium sp. HD4P20]